MMVLEEKTGSVIRIHRQGDIQVNLDKLEYRAKIHLFQ